MSVRKHSRKRPAAPSPPEEYWLYGRHAVMAALANPARRKIRLFMTDNARHLVPADRCRDLEVETARGPKALAHVLPAGAVHQGMALLVAPLASPRLAEILERREAAGESPLVVVLDQVTDPQNVGAIMRAAAAFGAHAIVTTPRHAPAEGGALAKAASGALDIVPYVRVPNLARALGELGAYGFWRLGLAGEADATLADGIRPGPLAFVLGAEGKGLRRLTREHCDVLVRLPVTEAVESLNVAAAAAVSLYEVVRQRPRAPDAR